MEAVLTKLRLLPKYEFGDRDRDNFFGDIDITRTINFAKINPFILLKIGRQK